MVNLPDTPEVIAAPRTIAVATVISGLLLDYLLPSSKIAALLSFWPRIVIGTILLLAGGRLALAGAQRFHAIGTDAPPWMPSLQLETTGIYSRMRNPTYVGTILMVLGIAIWFASDWTLLLLVPAAIILHYGVVLREERYLEKQYGEDYVRYKQGVPRWGLW